MAEPLPDDWWTTGDVARFLRISPSTVRAYVTRGQMPQADRRIGREPVWRPATIREWDEQRRKPDSRRPVAAGPGNKLVIRQQIRDTCPPADVRRV